jgi:hypothetical protein
MHVGILDDYQRISLALADWSAVQSLAEVTVSTGIPTMRKLPRHSSGLTPSA